MKKASQSAPRGTSVSIETADKSTIPAILSLLASSELPKEGLAGHLATTLVAREGKRIVGSAALELYGTAALLRSVAVEESLRGRGLGHKLTLAALDLAKGHRISAVYLLTMTAEKFFSRLGFRRISRSEVPGAVQRSVEFTSACPVSAVVMMMRLENWKGDCAMTNPSCPVAGDRATSRPSHHCPLLTSDRA